MIAILITKWTKYDYNDDYERDFLNIITISVLKRIIYDCNAFQKGPNIIAMSKFVLESHDYDF